MKLAISTLLCTVMAASGICQRAPGGARSASLLASRYLAAVKKKDLKAAYALVYWEGVDDRSKEVARANIKSDLESAVSSVKIVALPKGEKLEYSIKGIVYRPTLPPIARMFVTYVKKTNDPVTSTSYLVGKGGAAYWITLASPVRSSK